MTSYPIANLGDLAANDKWAITIGPFGSKMKSDLYVPTGIPVIRGANISGGNEISGDWVYVTEDFAQTIPNCVTHTGELLFPHRGAIGEVALVKDHHPKMVISSSLMKLRPDRSRALPEYLFYFFSSDEGRKEILRFSSSVGTPGIGQPLTSLRQFRVPLPDLATQNQIASVLSALDDKIELNRRMNETLEALAQAIFKDWFVTFGPTRRKMEGTTDASAILGGLIQDAPAEVGTGSASGASANNAPTKAAHLAALFPGSFGEDGLPEGWEDKGLDEVAEFLNGLALQKYPPTGDDDLPVIKIAELRAGFTAKTNRANRTIADKYLIKEGDFLFSWSGSLMAKFWTEGEGALNQHLFKVSSSTHPRWFYSQWVHHHMAEFQTIAASKATTMGHIQRGHLSAARVIVPPKPTLDAMTAIFEPFIERIIHNDLENRTLAETRDYLLPKLMSGAVRVRDAEAVVEGVEQ